MSTVSTYKNSKVKSAKGKKASNFKLSPAMVVLAQVMHESGLSYSAIGTELGVDGVTVSRAIARKKVEDKCSDEEILSRLKGSVANMFLDKATQALQYADEDKFKEASLHSISTFVGTMYDKFRLASGQSTSNVSMNMSMQISNACDAELVAIREEREKKARGKTIEVKEPVVVDYETKRAGQRASREKKRQGKVVSITDA